MFKEKRVDEVYKYIMTHNQATVEELTKEFQVSAMTVRRDLNSLERAGVINRTHGGAISVDFLSYEERYEQKQSKNAEVKGRIARRALELIREGDIVFLDSGTTTYQLALMIKRMLGNITVFTNDLKIAAELYDTPHDVLIIGGRIQRETGSIIGSITNSYIQNVNFDLCFIGTQAINSKLCLLTPSEDKAMNKQAFIKKAAVKALICDASKFCKNGLFTIESMDTFDYVITDYPFSPQQLDTLRRSHTTVVSVKKNEGGEAAF